MRKTIGLALNNYPHIPQSLRTADGATVDVIDIDLAKLFHHYYLDTRGYAPPDPDFAQFEHLELLLPCAEVRVRGDGFGSATTFRRHRSNELGQAFCRWFLYEHLGITYFAHMDHVLDRRPDPNLGGYRVERVEPGDAPDYLCAGNAAIVFMAEAKGRTTSVSFGNAEFKSWRTQFKRVVVKDAAGEARSVKGHIVATRFATEVNRASVKSTLFAEDPASPGREPAGEAPDLSSMVVALHYSEIAAKLRQPLLAAALRSGIPVPEEIQFPVAVWEFRLGPLQGRRFVGGYFPGTNGAAPIQLDGGKTIVLSSNPLRLDIAPGSFFGVEENIFRQVCAMGRGGETAAGGVERFPDVAPFYSAVSLLRDGSVIGPVEFFSPVGFTTF